MGALRVLSQGSLLGDDHPVRITHFIHQLNHHTFKNIVFFVLVAHVKDIAFEVLDKRPAFNRDGGSFGQDFIL